MDNHSFSQSELLLLTGSKDQDVQVRTPDVPPESTRLYPKLVSSHWECYITSDYLILGRSPGPDAPPPRSGRQHRVDVDFGSHRRDVSRRHADIRFNNSKQRWELRIYGRNGVKVNNVLKRPKTGSIVLNTGSLLEIGDNRCVFILPDRSAPVTTLDSRLENLIMDAFKDQALLDTTAIVNYVNQNSSEKTATTTGTTTGTTKYDRASVLHALVLSKRFQLKGQEWCTRQGEEQQQQQESMQTASSSIVSQQQQQHEQQQQQQQQQQQRETPQRDLCKQMSLDDIEYDYGDRQNIPQFVGSEEPTQQQQQSGRIVKKSLGMSVQQIYSTWVAAKKRSMNRELIGTNDNPPPKRFVSYNPEIDSPWKDVMWRELRSFNSTTQFSIE